MKPFDPNGYFQIGSADAISRRVAIHGAAVSILAAAVSFVAQLASTVILARLLTPSDFGVVVMVNTFSLLLCSFGWNGFTEAILQRESISEALASNLFWINLGGGIILTLLFACMGPVLSHFYHEPLVINVTVAMSLTVIASNVGVIHSALLNRATHYKAVSINGLVSRIICLAVSIVLALAGWSYWALVVGAVMEQVSKSIGSFILCPWLPRLPRKSSGTWDAVKFSMNIYWRRCLTYVSGNVDNTLVGWRFGAAELGFYKRAFDLFWLPANQLLSPMSAVAVGTLSRLNKDRAAYERSFLTGIASLSLIGMAIGGDFALVGKDLIVFLLGPQWAEAGRIFSLFGVGIGVMMLYQTHTWIHISIGRAGRSLRWGIIELVWTVGLFIAALPWGARGIAAAWTISYFTLTIPAFWYAGKPIGLHIMSVIFAVWKFFAASALAGFAIFYLNRIVPLQPHVEGSTGALLRATLNSVLFFAAYILAVIVLHRGLGPLQQAARLLSEIMPKRSSKPEVAIENSVVVETEI